MTLRSRAGAGIAGLSILLTSASMSPSGAAPVRAGEAIRHGGAQQPNARTFTFRQSSIARRPYAGADCTDDASASFIGIPGVGDYAQGSFSAVAGGNSNQACDTGDAILGGSFNYVGNAGNAPYSSIAGGENNYVYGEYAFIGGGFMNQAKGAYSAVAGGYENFTPGTYAFVGGGVGNIGTGPASFVGAGAYNNASGNDSFIGGGEGNSASGNGSFIGAGGYTYITTGGNAGKTSNVVSGTDSFLGAGDNNSVAATESFIGSGLHNTITSAGAYSVLGGGAYNTVSGEYAAVLGGYGNTASGEFSTVAGGDANTASGELSFAGGYHATASHNGSFVWADFSSGEKLADTAVNQFVVRASGGVYFFSNAGSTSGVELAPGSGTWASLSDRNAKTAIVPVDGDSILSKVAALPVSAWSYKTEYGVRHLGPMAQDFYSAFGVGEDDRHITSIDEDGVALAAIKTLNARVASKDHEIDMLRAELHRIEARVGYGK